jgi:hypothetical protein
MNRTFRKAATSLLLILAVALGARLGFAWNQTRKIPTEVLGTVPFQTETGNVAYSLATGKGFASPYQRDSGPTAMLPPVYPSIVAGIFKIFGVCTRASFFAAVFLNILFSTAACVPIFYAGKRIAGIGSASAAAWLWATLGLAESKLLRDWCGYGLLWGVALMTNPALASVFPLLLGWLVYRMGGERRLQLARPALAAALALICCIPWTARNYVVFHRFIPLRSNLGFELYIGNNENYDERRRAMPAGITQDREILRYLRIGETAFMDEEKHKAFQFMASHPRVEMELFAKRFVDFWLGTAEPLKMFLETDSLLIRGLLLGNFLSSLGALFGVTVLFLRRSEYAFPLAAFPAVFPILYYVTHTSLRYRHPIDPVALLLAAIAAAAMLRKLQRHRVAADITNGIVKA